jgi:hypothetical protein
MDRFVPEDDDSFEMIRHLRPVPTTTAPEGPTYLIGRSEYAEPGAPYVAALCVDHRMASTLALAGQEVYQRDEMEKDSALAQALKAWEAGDDRVHRAERAARAAFTKSERTLLFRQVSSQHPSVLAKGL